MFRSRAGLLYFVHSEGRVYENTGERPRSNAFMLFATASARDIMLRKPTEGQVYFAWSKMQARRSKRASISREVLGCFSAIRTGFVLVHPSYDVVRRTYGVRAAFNAVTLVWRLTKGKVLRTSPLFSHMSPDLVDEILSFAEPTFDNQSAFRTEYGTLSYIYTLW